MSKRVFKPGNMLYPVPAALVSCMDKEGRSNLITVAWTGTICSDPPMLYISVRPERYSYHMIEETGEFVLNLTTKDMVKGVDLCGVKSGKSTDKWALAGFTPEKGAMVSCPLVKESPVNLECRVKEIRKLGSHDMFLAEIVAVDVDERYFDQNDRFCLNDTGLVAYSHGEYFELGKKLGSFGYSVKGTGKK